MGDLTVLVNQHDLAVRTVSENRVRYRENCPSCNGQLFAPHEVRPRFLRLIVAEHVVVMTLRIARWRCLECRRIWTDYPPFCLAI